MWVMTRRWISMLVGLLLLADGAGLLRAEAPGPAVAAFNSYCRKVEAGLAEQHRSASGFVVMGAGEEARERGGEVVVEKLAGLGDLDGAMVHDWRGTAFAAGATAADFERLMRDFEAYPKNFAPQVLEAKTVSVEGDRMQAWMRVRQRHVITVVMDGRYDIEYGRLDARHGYSVSRSTEMEEMVGGRPLGASEEHGFLWRLNTYWSYEERDGGLYLQVEAVSLTRAVPRGLGWAIGPYVESVPRESMEFTLQSAVKALRK